MDFSIIYFIKSYGYISVMIGSIFEGESIVLLGGLSSFESHLFFPLVVMCATFGAIVGDWSFFFLGRYKKDLFSSKFTYFKKFMKTPIYLIENKPKMISFGMRFMYGFRHVVPFSLGVSKIPTTIFLFWNFLGAITWAVIFTAVGYLTGDIFQIILGNIRKYEFRIIVITILIFVFFNFILKIIRFFIAKSD
jgi:membrane protein DedA with SNARE-associated domain